MKRASGLWEHVVAFERLRAAALRAARGKRRVRGVARFLADLEPEVLWLQRALEDGSWRPGSPTTFRIHDPKERTITAAPFRDRVVHHALMAVLEPVLERRMVHESFACRKGKGTHAALDHARRRVRRHGWFLKLDIAKCFDSLGHDVVLDCLRRCVKDRRVLELAEVIVRGAGGRGGVGLPIGSLTSQWFANLVLDRVDHFVKEELRVRGYVRYMDDFVLFADEKRELRDHHLAVQTFVEDELALQLKPRATLLAPTSQGLPFLGWRLYRGTTRLRPQNLKRIRARLRHRAWEYRGGRATEAELAASVRSITEHLRHGSTLALRRRLFEGEGSLAARTGSTGAAAFTTTRGTRAPRIATGTTPAIAGTTSAFALAKASYRPIASVTLLADRALCTGRPGPSPVSPDGDRTEAAPRG